MKTQRKVKGIFDTEIWYLYYMNNKLIETFTSYQEVCEYCSDNNFNLVESKGI